jgi:FKBP-type peptidyl-prolyl cis-trans isomerase FkpA
MIPGAGVNLVRVVRPVFAAALFAALSFAAACSDTPTSPSLTVSFSQSDLRGGSGPAAVSGNVLTVHYTGWLYDADRPEQKGGLFDSSAGLTPFSFTLGAGQVITGWDRGLVGMQQGAVRRLVIPASLAYGDTRSGAIPPNATLLFEVELVTLTQ